MAQHVIAGVVGAAEADGGGRSLLQRILLPRAGEPLDVRTLYLEEAATNARRAHPTSRTSVRLGAESEVSFATYFGAFPAGYWRRWTVLDEVVLRVEVRGECRVDVYRSKADGSRIHVAGRKAEGAAARKADGGVEDGAGGAAAGGLEGAGGHSGPDVQTAVVEFRVSLAPFEDGGWIWFDVTTATKTELVAAGWYAQSEAPGRASIALGIPTFNRPADCVNALRAIGSDPLVLDVVDAVILPDQGTDKVRDHPDFAEASAPVADRLLMYDQPNLGGSGGYSRVMLEALRSTDCEQILFMDDDIEIEPDAILRALAFSRFAKTPMLVGGQMLNLQERSHLHTMGEAIDRGVVMWTGAAHTEYDHDFAKYPLSDRDDSKNLHRRIDVDGNGWWMCMIPRACAEEIGQPMPFFIKWDDWEFALRARAAGYPTATVPGVAIWHMAWTDKDDAIDWQAYFHLRNRLIVASLHFPDRIGGVLRSSAKATAKHLLCLEYSTVAIQNRAIRDFLAGPQHIIDILDTALPAVRAMRAEYPDAVVVGSSAELPMASHAGVPAVGEPTNPLSKVARLAKGLAHNMRPADPAAHVTPQLNVPTIDSRWFLLSQVDGVTVTTADGRGVVYRQRDRARAAALLRESLRLHRELKDRFAEVAAQYREAAPEMAGRERWARAFEAYGAREVPVRAKAARPVAAAPESEGSAGAIEG